MKEQRKSFWEPIVYVMGFSGVLLVAVGIVSTFFEVQHASDSLATFRLLCYYFGHALLLISGFVFCILPKRLS